VKPSNNTINLSPLGGDAEGRGGRGDVRQPTDRGIIFDIKHYAIHDGPGIRQTIFMKGCPLGCWWCHNPESRSKEIISYNKEEKIDGRIVEKEETVGRHYTVEALWKEIEKDIVFFEESGGGVTFSGGEPLLQFDFLLEMLKLCKKRDIHTCVDNTGFADQKKLKTVARYTDLFLFDLKHMDEKEHIRYTGVTNRKILDNLKMLDELGKEIQIRYPLIPGMNDEESHLFRMLDFLNGLKHKYSVSILPYHKIGSHKYKRFGLEYKMNGVKEPSKKRIEEVASLFSNAGFKVTVGG